MPIPFVQSIDMNDFQILNFVVHSAGSAPTNTGTLGGMMWWDSSNVSLKVHNGTSWLSLVKGPASSTSNNIPQWDGTGGDAIKAGLSLKTTLADPGLDTALASEKAIRSAISTALVGGVTYKGGYNAATNTPLLDSTPIAGIKQGDMYTVTVAGTFFTDPVDIGDVLIAEQDDPTALTHWTVVNRNIAETFLALGDTPSAYTASGGYMVMVDSTPDALEFVNPSGYALSNFSNDLVAFGTVDQIPFMNTGATAFEYTDSLKMIGGVLTAANVRVSSLAAASTRYATIDSDGDIGVVAAIPLVDIASYADGSVIIGGVSDWTTVTAGTAGFVLTMGAARPEWASPGAPAAHALLGTAHSDTVTEGVTRGSLVYGNSTPAWDELVVGGATTFLYTDGTDVSWKDVDFTDLGTTPTTLSGYGISDTKANFNTALSDGSFAFSGGAFHDGFSDFVADEHIDHSSVSLTVAGTASEISSSAGAQTIAASRTWTIGLADNPVIPGTAHIYIPHGTNAQEIGTTPGQLRYDDQSGVFRGNVAGTWRTFATAGGAYHDGFSDFVANEHINHTSVTLTAGNGLSGGGTIAANRTFALDINSLSAETTIAGGDFLAFWDITATATNKKITFTNFLTQVSSGLTGVPTVKVGDLAAGASPVITHSLNLTEFTDCIVQIWRQSDNKVVGVDIDAATKDTVTVLFGSAAINPSIGAYRYVVTGIQG